MKQRRIWSTAALFGGALVFLFPFYYMVIGSLQKKPDTTVKGAFPTGGFTLHNYSEINSRVDLLQSLFNSVVFTGGVLLGTVVFGVLAGYALARLHFRGRGTLFAVMLLVQIIPFQLLIIPIYVMIVRTYGLADSYMGMIAAVRDQLHRRVRLPPVLPAAARGPVRRGGAGRRERAPDHVVDRAAAGAPRHPDRDPADLHRAVERVPLAVPGDQGPSPQPLAVTLANYISNIAGRADNPYGAILAGAVVLAAPAVALFVVFQRKFTGSELSSGVKG